MLDCSHNEDFPPVPNNDQPRTQNKENADAYGGIRALSKNEQFCLTRHTISKQGLDSNLFSIQPKQLYVYLTTEQF